MNQGQRVDSVYVHVPFCRSRCSYCDFAIQVGTAGSGNFAGLILSEFDLRGYEPDAVKTLFFGGGTPSLLNPSVIGQIVRRVGASELTEVSLEANPEDVTEEMCARLREEGVTRLSLGVQSFDETTLAYFGRHHGAKDALFAIKSARKGGFKSVSVDLIYGRPGENERSWRDTVLRALESGVDHVSAYGLTVERATALGKRMVVVDDTVAARHYMVASELLEGAGFVNYEISNWAKPGHECQHNWNYWRRGEYLGVGPSAHSKIGNMRSWNTPSLPRYEMRVAAGLVPQEGCERETPESVALERLYLGLRTREGVPACGPIPDWAAGLIVSAEGRWMLSRAGRIQADAIVARLA